MAIIDLFSGAGGLTEGFFRSDFEIISHIEMDSHASKTLETRALYHLLKNNNLEDEYYSYLMDDLSRKELFENNLEFSKLSKESVINEEISESNINIIIKKIRNKMNNLAIKQIEGIIGGPPCQAYSVIGRSRSPNCMKDDPRNFLYKFYIRFLKEFDPDFFIFENVPGMLTAQNREIYEDFTKQITKINPDYKIDENLLDATNFNVLQARKRLIFIGHKFDTKFSEKSFIFKKKNKFVVSDVLNDLPFLEPNCGSDSPQKYRSKRSKYLSIFDIRTKKDVLLQHNARYHNDRDREIYRYAIDIWEREGRRLQYDELPLHLKTHNNKKSFVDRFKVIAGNLNASHTIMAHMAKDGHYYIHPDKNQARSLTVREAARIQSFPDNFKFEGPRTSQYKQLGNAVPPLMAEGMANIIKNFV